MPPKMSSAALKAAGPSSSGLAASLAAIDKPGSSVIAWENALSPQLLAQACQETPNNREALEHVATIIRAFCSRKTTTSITASSTKGGLVPAVFVMLSFDKQSSRSSKGSTSSTTAPSSSSQGAPKNKITCGPVDGSVLESRNSNFACFYDLLPEVTGSSTSSGEQDHSTTSSKLEHACEYFGIDLTELRVALWAVWLISTTSTTRAASTSPGRASSESEDDFPPSILEEAAELLEVSVESARDLLSSSSARRGIFARLFYEGIVRSVIEKMNQHLFKNGEQEDGNNHEDDNSDDGDEGGDKVHLIQLVPHQALSSTRPGSSPSTSSSSQSTTLDVVGFQNMWLRSAVLRNSDKLELACDAAANFFAAQSRPFRPSESSLQPILQSLQEFNQHFELFDSDSDVVILRQKEQTSSSTRGASKSSSSTATASLNNIYSKTAYPYRPIIGLNKNTSGATASATSTSRSPTATTSASSPSLLEFTINASWVESFHPARKEIETFTQEVTNAATSVLTLDVLCSRLSIERNPFAELLQLRTDIERAFTCSAGSTSGKGVNIVYQMRQPMVVSRLSSSKTPAESSTRPNADAQLEQALKAVAARKQIIRGAMKTRGVGGVTTGGGSSCSSSFLFAPENKKVKTKANPQSGGSRPASSGADTDGAPASRAKAAKSGAKSSPGTTRTKAGTTTKAGTMSPSAKTKSPVSSKTAGGGREVGGHKAASGGGKKGGKTQQSDTGDDGFSSTDEEDEHDDEGGAPAADGDDGDGATTAPNFNFKGFDALTAEGREVLHKQLEQILALPTTARTGGGGGNKNTTKKGGGPPSIGVFNMDAKKSPRGGSGGDVKRSPRGGGASVKRSPRHGGSGGGGQNQNSQQEGGGTRGGNHPGVAKSTFNTATNKLRGPSPFVNAIGSAIDSAGLIPSADQSNAALAAELEASKKADIFDYIAAGKTMAVKRHLELFHPLFDPHYIEFVQHWLKAKGTDYAADLDSSPLKELTTVSKDAMEKIVGRGLLSDPLGEVRDTIDQLRQQANNSPQVGGRAGGASPSPRGRGTTSASPKGTTAAKSVLGNKLTVTGTDGKRGDSRPIVYLPRDFDFLPIAERHAILEEQGALDEDVAKNPRLDKLKSADVQSRYKFRTDGEDGEEDFPWKEVYTANIKSGIELRTTGGGPPPNAARADKGGGSSSSTRGSTSAAAPGPAVPPLNAVSLHQALSAMSLELRICQDAIAAARGGEGGESSAPLDAAEGERRQVLQELQDERNYWKRECMALWEHVRNLELEMRAWKDLKNGGSAPGGAKPVFAPRGRELDMRVGTDGATNSKYQVDLQLDQSKRLMDELKKSLNKYTM